MILVVVYRERADLLPGAVVWQAVPTPDDPADKRVLPDGCMDLMWSAG